LDISQHLKKVGQDMRNKVIGLRGLHRDPEEIEGRFSEIPDLAQETGRSITDRKAQIPRWFE
jgi:hypothetical protein